QAGTLLASAIEEWGPDGQVRELALQAADLQDRLSRLKDSLTVPDDGRGGVFGRRAGVGDRRQVQEEFDALNQEHRSLAVRLGRSAPQPSIKEADDILVAARTLDERAGWLTAGLAEVDEAEQMRADAAVAAQRELAAAQEARVRALQEARRAVEASESDHAWAGHLRRRADRRERHALPARGRAHRKCPVAVPAGPGEGCAAVRGPRRRARAGGGSAAGRAVPGGPQGRGGPGVDHQGPLGDRGCGGR